MIDESGCGTLRYTYTPSSILHPLRKATRGCTNCKALLANTMQHVLDNYLSVALSSALTVWWSRVCFHISRTKEETGYHCKGKRHGEELSKDFFLALNSLGSIIAVARTSPPLLYANWHGAYVTKRGRVSSPTQQKHGWFRETIHGVSKRTGNLQGSVPCGVF